MSMRLFTVREANELLVHVRPLVQQLIDLQQQVDDHVEEALTDLPDASLNVGSPAATELAHNFASIESILTQINDYGCQIKDIHLGLIDFYAEVEGRIVNLCWKVDESAIAHYHELDEGFDNRRPLN